MKPKNKSIFKVDVFTHRKSYLEPGMGYTGRGHGSGFCIEIKNKKYIITNNHVIEHGSNITVSDMQRKFEATVLMYDKLNDIAILNCEFDDAEPLKIGEIYTGDTIFVQGFPLHYRGLTVARGVVSKLSKLDIGISKNLVYFSDTLIAGGNSGGPVLDEKNKVVGILTYGIHGSYSMFVPFFILDNFLYKFQNSKELTYNYLNLNWQIVYAEFLCEKDIKNTEGIVVWYNDKPIHITHIEGIKILEEGQIKVSDFYKYLGYNSVGTEFISFQYLIPLLRKKTVTFTAGDKKKIEVKLDQFTYTYENPIFVIYGDYIFAPVTNSLLEETGSSLPRNKVIIVFSKKNVKFEKKILDIHWNDFINLLDKSTKIIKLKFYQDSWRFYLDPKSKINTKKTAALFSV